MGPLIPLFWTSGDVSSGLQSQSGQPYSYLVKVYVIKLDFWTQSCEVIQSGYKIAQRGEGT